MKPKLSRRPAIKTPMVKTWLRDRVLSGELSPGSRLPTRRDFQKQFGVSVITVERAFQELIRDGFLTTHGRRGTFVAAHPPHLTRYALVFPHAPGMDWGWSRFYEALQTVARQFTQTERRQLTVYYNVVPHLEAEEYQRLVADVQAKRVAGLIFGFYVDELVKTPLLTTAGLPRVAVMSHTTIPGLPLVYPDLNSMIDRGLDHLKERGCRRVAVLSTVALYEFSAERFRQGAAARGMRTAPYWIQTVDTWLADGIRNCVHLLFRGQAAERPDGLFILDDNLVTSATAGLVAAGVKDQSEVAVVAHCNFPCPPQSLFPITMLGFDASLVLERCLAVIDAQRRGQVVLPQTALPAQFEHERAPSRPLLSGRPLSRRRAAPMVGA
jgi:DNA-binding LacI/PurR family transcriptional regulator